MSVIDPNKSHSTDEAKIRWQNSQKAVNTLSKMAPLAAVILIANEIFILLTRGFRVSTLPKMYFCAEVIVLSPAIKKFFNNAQAIPFFFSDKELKNEDETPKDSALEEKKASAEAFRNTFKTSLTYRAYAYVQSYLNEIQ